MQIDYTNSLDSGALTLGQVADNSVNQIDGFMAEESIPFGAPVQRGTIAGIPAPAKNAAASKPSSAPLVKKLTTGGTYIGVAIRDNNQPIGSVLASVGDEASMSDVTIAFESYPKGAGVSVMRLGRVAIMIPMGTVMTNGAIGLPVAYKLADGTISFLAAPTPDSGSVVTIGTLLTTPLEGQLAIIQVNKLI